MDDDGAPMIGLCTPEIGLGTPEGVVVPTTAIDDDPLLILFDTASPAVSVEFDGNSISLEEEELPANGLATVEGSIIMLRYCYLLLYMPQFHPSPRPLLCCDCKSLQLNDSRPRKRTRYIMSVEAAT